jgi:hypothetical protein
MGEESSPVSYIMSLFEFFAHEALQSPKEKTLSKFIVDALDFLSIGEAK